MMCIDSQWFMSKRILDCCKIAVKPENWAEDEVNAGSAVLVETIVAWGELEQEEIISAKCWASLCQPCRSSPR